MKRLLCLLAVGAAPVLASASDLDLQIRSAGQANITVSPGQLISYDVVGELSDANNEGLALFSIDLGMPGATLTPLSFPSSANMLNFAKPLGMTNPAGFGGTQMGSALRQIGGMQNTLKNSFAPVPSGSVLTGIAQFGAPETLATGMFNAPTVSGDYTLAPTNVIANVIRMGQSGSPTWMCDKAGIGTLSGLHIKVTSLTNSTGVVSLNAGGTVNFFLDGGSASAGRVYLMLGSATGTSPGVPVDGLVLDLAYDAFTGYMLTHPNTPPYAGTFGLLDGTGTGSASLSVAPGTNPGLVGTTLYHAFAVLDAAGTVSLTSNATSLNLLP